MKLANDGNEYKIGKLSTKVNYGKVASNSLVLGFLVHTGYLTYKDGKVLKLIISHVPIFYSDSSIQVRIATT